MVITCPHCWQAIDIEEPLYDEQPTSFVTDCEVCCRPIVVSITWASTHEPPDISVEPESRTTTRASLRP